MVVLLLIHAHSLETYNVVSPFLFFLLRFYFLLMMDVASPKHLKVLSL